MSAITRDVRNGPGATRRAPDVVAGLGGRLASVVDAERLAYHPVAFTGDQLADMMFDLTTVEG